MKPIEEIRAALQHIHAYAMEKTGHPYMSIPADPKRDADLILSAAIDELANLRAEVPRADALTEQAKQMSFQCAEETRRATEQEKATAAVNVTLAAEVERLRAEVEALREGKARLLAEVRRLEAEVATARALAMEEAAQYCETDGGRRRLRYPGLWAIWVPKKR